MDKHLIAFCQLLRHHQVPVSTAESLDALTAVQTIGIADRNVLKATLKTTLIKSNTHCERFNKCFDRYFSEAHFHLKEDTAELSPDITTSGKFQPSTLSQQLINQDQAAIQQSINVTAQQLNLQQMQVFTQRGVFTQRLFQALGGHQVDQDIARLTQLNPQLNHDLSLNLADTLKRRRNQLFDQIKDYIAQQYLLYGEPQSLKNQLSMIQSIPLNALEKRHLLIMEQLLRKTAKRLASRFSRKKLLKNSGRLSMPHTLRRNLQYQGVIIEPHFKHKKRSRSDLLIICDISRSVSQVARFFLLLVYGLNQAFNSVHSFVFSAKLTAISHLMDNSSAEHIIPKIINEHSQGVTDYGHILKTLTSDHENLLTRHTTLIFLGDARNNYGDGAVKQLELCYQRVKRLIWLNPEPESFWGSGDSIMPLYQHYCHNAYECRSYWQLVRCVDRILNSI